MSDAREAATVTDERLAEVLGHPHVVGDREAGLIGHGHRHARAVVDEDDLERLVREQARPGDIVVCLGAGTISAWANALPKRLAD